MLLKIVYLLTCRPIGGGEPGVFGVLGGRAGSGLAGVGGEVAGCVFLQLLLSATSDIELDRVEGVHGPRLLEVIVVSPE